MYSVLEVNKMYT